ncbi:hypothetical protein [Nitrosophilus labii]|uniref:hypothetical protein n=1 Tax=Nitrosophilus labii TaxID=2706014 RepID=UPI001656BAC2|nr:hypothetical protein [Nitrosophilus labii]
MLSFEIGKKRISGIWKYLYDNKDIDNKKVILEFDARRFEELAWNLSQDNCYGLLKYFEDAKIKIKNKKD